MGETLDSEDVAAWELYGSIDWGFVVIAGFPDVVREGRLAYDAEAIVGGDVFDFDVGGGEEEVELRGYVLQFG